MICRVRAPSRGARATSSVFWGICGTVFRKLWNNMGKMYVSMLLCQILCCIVALHKCGVFQGVWFKRSHIWHSHLICSWVWRIQFLCSIIWQQVNKGVVKLEQYTYVWKLNAQQSLFNIHRPINESLYLSQIWSFPLVCLVAVLMWTAPWLWTGMNGGSIFCLTQPPTCRRLSATGSTARWEEGWCLIDCCVLFT